MTLNATQQRSLIWLALLSITLLLLWALGPVLTPFVIAAVLAYVLAPLVQRLQQLPRFRLPKVLAVVVVELAFLLALLSVGLLMVPILIKEIPLLREQVPLLFERLNVALQPLLAQWGVSFSFDIATIKAFVLKYLNANFDDAATQVLSSLKLGGSVALALIGNAVLIPVALFYLLLDWRGLIGRLHHMVPRPMRAGVLSFLAESDAVLGQYLRGQMLVMLAMSVFYSVGLALFGLELALPIGVFTGLAMFVPYVGFGLGLVLALLAGLLQFALLKAVLMVAVVYGLGQLLESFVLTPRLVGERIGLHPLAAIFALLAFGQLLGLVGVLVALPASAVLLVALRRLRQQYLSSKLYLG